MASLETRLRNLATRLGTEFKAVRAELAAALAARPRGVSSFCAGKPANSEIVLSAIAPYAFTVSAANSSAKAQAAATGSTVFQAKKNGTNMCTITFAAAGSTATIGTVTGGTIASGDVITIHGPAGADATCADIAFLLRE